MSRAGKMCSGSVLIDNCFFSDSNRVEEAAVMTRIDIGINNDRVIFITLMEASATVGDPRSSICNRKHLLTSYLMKCGTVQD